MSNVGSSIIKNWKACDLKIVCHWPLITMVLNNGRYIIRWFNKKMVISFISLHHYTMCNNISFRMAITAFYNCKVVHFNFKKQKKSCFAPVFRVFFLKTSTVPKCFWGNSTIGNLFGEITLLVIATNLNFKCFKFERKLLSFLCIWTYYYFFKKTNYTLH